MATNISKYVALSDFLLLEYEFNRDGTQTTLTSPTVVTTALDTNYFYEGNGALGGTNNILSLNAVPTNDQRTTWFIDIDTPNLTYPAYWDSSIAITPVLYTCDSIKVHIVSGYNFDEIGGFLLQIRAMDNSSNLVDLANFAYIKQPNAIANGVINFDSNTLYLGNRFYDKYIQFKVPSIQSLGGDITPSPALGGTLNISAGSDVYVTYSTIFDIVNGFFTPDDTVNVQLPVTSVADNFNCFIAESTAGDFIEYYATWANTIIGNYMGDIESGRIQLYTSNNPNDNYQNFTDSYGTNSAKWVIIHEISVIENIPGGTSLVTQKYSFTQDSGFSTPNYFRPILVNSDIDSSYTIQYTCRLTNRMDGTQIIRKASFASTDPKKYGINFTRLTVENLLPYNVFNMIEPEAVNTVANSSGLEKTTYVKVFFDTTKVTLNAQNEVFPQGTGPLFLKSLNSTYLFKFEQLDSNGNSVNVDLSGAYNYALVFKLDDNTTKQISPTYSTNMNTTLGELEFALTVDLISLLNTQKNNNYSIVVLNPNGSSYTFYEGVYYSITNQTAVMANYQSLFNVTDLQTQIANLQAQVNSLTAQNAALQAK